MSTAAATYEQEHEEEEDFVFKPATSPKLNETNNKSSQESIKQESSKLPVTQSQTNNIPIRFPLLDNLINEKKKEMDLELNKVAKERFEEFLEREKTENEPVSNYQEDNNKNVDRRDKLLSQLELLDEKEAELFDELRIKAKETWQHLKSEYQKSLEHLHSDHSARLSHELQLQESLQASGSVFDRELFEKVVEKCGKGRATAFGREKMARFWEVLDKTHPKTTNTTTSPTKLDEDKLLASLLGL